MEKSAVTENKHKTLRFLLSVFGFMLVFLIIFNSVSGLLVHPEDTRSYTMIKGFYEEEENSLDAVFVGSSTTYADFNPLIAWEQYGITCYSFTCPAMPLYAAKYMCKEARKTQPDALYVFNLMTLCEYFEKDQLFGFHALVDYMPVSLNRIMLTAALCKNAGYGVKKSEEFFVPLIRYHGQWENFDGAKVNMPFDGVKGASHYGKFLRNTRNLTDTFYDTEETLAFKEKDKKIEDCMNDLLDYLKKEKVNALFMTSPTTGKKKYIYKYINTAEEMAEKAGYPVIDMQNRKFLENEIGIDLKRDFYNTSHFNIHGCIKATKYISDYLVENYGFKNKKNDKGYTAGKSWNEAYNNYLKHISPFSLETEYTLKTEKGFFCPRINANINENGEVLLKWDAAEGADGYAIYKKDGDKCPFVKIAQGALSDLFYKDICKKGKTCTYVVTAYKGEGKDRVWSFYDAKGATVKF